MPQPHHNYRLTPCPRKSSSCKPGALKPENLRFSVEAPATPQLPVNSLSKKALKLQAWSSEASETKLFCKGPQPHHNYRLTPCPRKPSSCKSGALKPENLSFSVAAPATPQVPVNSLSKKDLKLQAWSSEASETELFCRGPSHTTITG